MLGCGERACSRSGCLALARPRAHGVGCLAAPVTSASTRQHNAICQPWPAAFFACFFQDSQVFQKHFISFDPISFPICVRVPVQPPL